MNDSLEAIARSLEIVPQPAAAECKTTVETRARDRHRVARVFRPFRALRDYGMAWLEPAAMCATFLCGSVHVILLGTIGIWLYTLIWVGTVYGWTNPDPLTVFVQISSARWGDPSANGASFRFACYVMGFTPIAAFLLTALCFFGHRAVMRCLGREIVRRGGEGLHYAVRLFPLDVDTSLRLDNWRNWGLLLIIEEIQRGISQAERKKLLECSEHFWSDPNRTSLERFEDVEALWDLGKHRRRLAKTGWREQFALMSFGCGLFLVLLLVALHYFKIALFFLILLGQVRYLESDESVLSWYMALYLLEPRNAWLHLVTAVLALPLGMWVLNRITPVYNALLVKRCVDAVRRNAPEFVRFLNGPFGIASLVEWRDEPVDSAQDLSEKVLQLIQRVRCIKGTSDNINVVIERPVAGTRPIGKNTSLLIDSDEVTVSPHWHHERLLTLVRRDSSGNIVERLPLALLSR